MKQMVKHNRIYLIASMIYVFMAVGSDAFSTKLQMSMSVDNGNAIQSRNLFGSRRSFLVGVGGASVGLVGGFSTSISPALASSTPATEVKAPDFELPNSTGEGTTSLKDLTKDGKWIVLYFYPGAFTSGCTLEARGFQRDISKYNTLNTQIVGVSVDPVEKNASFCNSEGLNFFMLSDEKGIVSKLYGSSLSIPGFGTFSNRQTYIIDPNGTLKWVFKDVESRVARHSQEVLEKLEELQKA